jgi:2-succinyl-5-enolpyruvyl-6-hydroxy-3-cyclohexene-1-carboxylate synthase
LLHVASSLPIRAVDAFGGLGRPGLTVTANRGANGIDGTPGDRARRGRGLGRRAGGGAAGRPGLPSRPERAGGVPAAETPVAIVVFDNAGGGIFDHLPIAAHPTAFEPHFITAPRVSLASTLAGLPARLEPAGSLLALRRALSLALATPGPTLIHVPVDRARDLARHQELRAAVCGGLPTLTASQGGPP